MELLTDEQSPIMKRSSTRESFGLTGVELRRCCLEMKLVWSGLGLSLD